MTLEVGVSTDILPPQASFFRPLSRRGKLKILGIIIIFWVTGGFLGFDLFFFFLI